MRVGAASAAALMLLAGASSPAWADNAMGYRLLTPQEASGLRAQGGTLGLDLQGAEMISEPGMTFEIMRVSGVHRGAPGARAVFRTGDDIVAVNGRVFPSLAVFAAFVHALPPGQPATVDYIPAGGGPAQAQRVQIVPGEVQQGMSTREKVAIGVGAAALFGCYELGCFRHHQPTPPRPQMQPVPVQ